MAARQAGRKIVELILFHSTKLRIFKSLRPKKALLLARAFFYCLTSAMTIAGLTGCALQPPLREYALARSAVESAKTQSAARYASGPWFDAEQAFEKAEQLFDEREYDKAKVLFLKAKASAEKAENAARYEKNQNGDVDL